LQYDVTKAREIAQKDDQIDEAAHSITEKAIEDMKRSSDLVIGAADYILVASYLERIGDYVTNICEWIVYHETGKVVELNTKNKDI